jgi:hypothetical protein
VRPDTWQHRLASQHAHTTLANGELPSAMAGLEPQPGIAAGPPGSPLRSCRFVSQLGLDANTGSLTTLREKLVRSAPASCAMAATSCFSWPRLQCRVPVTEFLRRIDGQAESRRRSQHELGKQ